MTPAVPSSNTPARPGPSVDTVPSPNDTDLDDLDDLPVLLGPGEWDHYLMTAVHEGDAPRVRRALKHGANPNALHPTRHLNALHLAVQDRRAWAIPLLVKAGADPEHPTGFNSRLRPLCLAVQGSLDHALPIVDRLLDAGANPCALNGYQEAPLDVLLGRLEATPDETQALLAVLDRLLDAVAQRGVPGRAKDPAMLHRVVNGGMPEVAQRLLDRGVAWTANPDGRTPLTALNALPPTINPFETDRRHRLRSVFEAFVLRQGMTAWSCPEGPGVRAVRARL